MNQLLEYDFPGFDHGPDEKCQGLNSECTTLALLYVCRESFSVASKFYEKAFGSCDAFAETWFDYDRETLYLDWAHGAAWGLGVGLSDWVDSNAGRVQKLALYERFYRSEGRLTSEFQNHEDWLCEVLRAFCGVKTLTIVAGKEHKTGESSELVFVTPMAVSTLTRHLSILARHLGMRSVAFESELWNGTRVLDVERLEAYRQDCISKELTVWATPLKVDCQYVGRTNIACTN